MGIITSIIIALLSIVTDQSGKKIITDQSGKTTSSSFIVTDQSGRDN